MEKRFRKTIKYFIPLAVVITLMSGLLYATLQQNYRQNANDPQIQMAEDIVTELNTGANPSGLNTSRKVDANKSLSPFLIVFDKNGEVLASNVVLSGKIPTPPKGVFDFKQNSIRQKLISKIDGGLSENRITWQPDHSTRIAAVIAPFNGGYVLAGRNLREVEIRQENLMHMIELGWVATVALSFASMFLLL